jgi:hypothetical protein
MWVEFSRRPAKGKMFVMALSIYSAVNVLAVAFFRYKNGDDGAMGQWYNAHTHFIAVAVAYYLFLKIKSDATVKNIAIYSALGFIFVLSAAGYSTDWKKAPYVAEYKQKFSQQALTILAFPETIKDKNDPYQTMLWDYDHVKPAIDLMFANRLWIFKKSAPIVSQVTSDSWLESKNPVTVLCPAGSTSLRVLAWRREDWKKSAITVQVGDVKRGMPVTNGELSISLPAKGAAVMLDGSDAEKSNPITIAPDTRQLVARVTDFKCQFGAATQ